MHVKGVAIALGIPVAALAGLVVRDLVADDPAHHPAEAIAPYPDGSRHVLLHQALGAVEALASGIAARIHPASDEHAPSSTQLAPATNALDAWAALERTSEVRGAPGLFRADARAPYNASVWSTSQVLNGAIDLAGRSGDWTDVNRIVDRSASRYGDGLWSDGVTGAPSSWSIAPHPFYDDNAWIALDLLQVYDRTRDPSWLRRVEGLVPLLASGVQPDGGVLWGRDEARPSVNTCAAGPVGQVFAQLYAATGNRGYLDTAVDIERYLVDHLRQPSGLYGDNVDIASGAVDPSPASYNQGAPIGLELELYRSTGDRAYLDRAVQTATAAVDWMSSGDTAWHQPPAFNAIFFRNLLALDGVAPDPSYRRLLDRYLQRAVDDGLDPESGLYTGGGIGHYGSSPGSAIDQGAMVQLFALAAGADPAR
ncbi:MAG: glycoside hydrolase family 76 [Thermoleophilia bacterium]|nr:glycoside hydrolase family 76 [Thermoleophilia bacterium]